MTRPPQNPGGGWRLVPYITENGRSQVLGWLHDDLTKRRDSFVEFYDETKGLLGRLERHGWMALEGTPAWKRYRGGLCAIRWGSDNCRIYCSVESDRRIAMYHGCFKTWRPFMHRDTCNERRKDFLGDGYDQQARELRYREKLKRRGQNG